MCWLEATWLGSGDMPRERCHVRARVAGRKGQVKLLSMALHQVHSGGCSPSSRARQTLARRMAISLYRKQLFHFMVTEAPCGTKSSGAPGLFHTVTGQSSTELPTLLALARAGCRGYVLARSSYLTGSHGDMVCFEGAGVPHHRGAQVPLSRRWTGHKKVVSLGRHEPAALRGCSAAWYCAVSGHRQRGNVTDWGWDVGGAGTWNTSLEDACLDFHRTLGDPEPFHFCWSPGLSAHNFSCSPGITAAACGTTN